MKWVIQNPVEQLEQRGLQALASGSGRASASANVTGSTPEFGIWESLGLSGNAQTTLNLLAVWGGVLGLAVLGGALGYAARRK